MIQIERTRFFILYSGCSFNHFISSPWGLVFYLSSASSGIILWFSLQFRSLQFFSFLGPSFFRRTHWVKLKHTLKNATGLKTFFIQIQIFENKSWFWMLEIFWFISSTSFVLSKFEFWKISDQKVFLNWKKVELFLRIQVWVKIERNQFKFKKSWFMWKMYVKFSKI